MHLQKQNLLNRVVRNVPGLFAALMLLGGFLAMGIGTAPATEAASATVQRTSDATANRSFARSGALDIPTTTAVPETTTTEAPVSTTTAAPVVVKANSGNVETGKASYYDYKAGGCAHKTLPKGTVITVTNLSNGKSTTCVVNDRGPYIAGRIIDLDTGVFKQIASTSAGVFSARISW